MFYFTVVLCTKVVLYDKKKTHQIKTIFLN